MKALKVLTTMLDAIPRSKRELSLDMGTSYTYLNNTVNRGSVPRADMFARIADVCGFDLLVRQRSTGDEMLIDPPTPKNNTK